MFYTNFVLYKAFVMNYNIVGMFLRMKAIRII